MNIRIVKISLIAVPSNFCNYKTIYRIDIFTMIFLGTIRLSSTLPLPLFLQLPASSGVAYPKGGRVRVAAKITAVGLGNPYIQLYM